MATIIKRRNPSGSVVYRVEYRLVGQKSLSKTFHSEKEAKQYVTVMDAKLIQDKHNALFGIRSTTFAQVIDRYIEEVQYRKVQSTQANEKYTLLFWRKQFGSLLVSAITSQHIVKVLRQFHQQAPATVHHKTVILPIPSPKFATW